jgi:hypothetical protein
MDTAVTSEPAIGFDVPITRVMGEAGVATKAVSETEAMLPNAMVVPPMTMSVVFVRSGVVQYASTITVDTAPDES